MSTSYQGLFQQPEPEEPAAPASPVVTPAERHWEADELFSDAGQPSAPEPQRPVHRARPPMGNRTGASRNGAPMRSSSTNRTGQSRSAGPRRTA